MATGTNGGAQEHVYSLVTRLNPECYDVRVVSLSHGSSVRRLQRAGIDVTVIDEPDDRLAVRALADAMAPFAPEIVHNHMYRAEVVGTRAALLLGEKGCRRPAVISTVHSSRIRCVEDRQTLRQLTPLMDRLIVVSRAIEQKVRDEGRLGAPVSLIYNGVDLQRYNHQQPCCTLHEEYVIPEDAPIVGVVARLEAEKGHRTLIDAWPDVLAAVPDAWLLIVGEGSERDSLEAEAASLGIERARRLHRPPRGRPGGHRRAGRLRAAVIPRGAGAERPGGDGPEPSRGRLQRGRHPGDDRGRSDRPARPAERLRRPRGRDHPAADGPPATRT